MTTQEHTDSLLRLYIEQLESESEGEFMVLVLHRAIRKLRGGVKPKKVENWVVTMEKNWRKF
jgi:hypothetical protein